MAAIDSAKKALALEPDTEAPSGLTLDDAYLVLSRVEQSLRRGWDQSTVENQWRGRDRSSVCTHHRAEAPSLRNKKLMASQRKIFFIFSRSPLTLPVRKSRDDTEDAFEKSPSWGSPAARLEAAQAVLDLVLQRPDLLPRF